MALAESAETGNQEATMRLKDKVAIVTGAGRGIGRAIAIRYGQEGAKVVVNYSASETAADEVVAAIRGAGGEAIALKADVAIKAEVDGLVQAALDAFGRIDILVNNAGICPFSDFLDISEDLWDRVQDVNLKGTFLCSQAVAKVMVERQISGRIIAVSSISAKGGGGQQAHYCPTKAGQDLLMKSMAIQLGPHGITCNSLAPGTIVTDINREDLANPAKREYMLSRIPLRRLGEPEDLAGPAVFLASDDAAYVTGAFLLVDGGFLGNLQ